MPNNYFLTGDICVGKTTIIKEVITTLKLSAGGFTVGREGQEGNFTKFYFVDPHIFFYQGIMKKVKNGIFASRDNGKKQWQVHLNAFNTTGVTMLNEGLNKKDILIIDEIGRFEEQAIIFQNKIFEILKTKKLILGVLKKENNPLLNKLSNDPDIRKFEVTIDNRRDVKNHLISLLNNSNREESFR